VHVFNTETSKPVPFRCNCIAFGLEQECRWQTGLPPTPPAHQVYPSQYTWRHDVSIWHTLTPSPPLPIWVSPTQAPVMTQAPAWAHPSPGHSPVSDPGALYLPDHQARPARNHNPVTLPPTENQANTDPISPPEHKIFVGNLPNDITTRVLVQHFHQNVPVLILDRLSPSSPSVYRQSLSSRLTYQFQPNPFTDRRIKNIELSRLRSHNSSSRSRGSITAVIELHNSENATHALRFLQGTILSDQVLDVEAYRQPEGRGTRRIGSGRGRGRGYEPGQRRSRNPWRTPGPYVEVPEQMRRDDRSLSGAPPSRPHPPASDGEQDEEEYRGPLIVDGRGTAGLAFCGVRYDE